MRLKSKTFLVIGGALCAFGAIFCAIILAIGQFDFMKVISVEKYEDKVYTLPAGALTALNLDAQNQRVVFQPAASSDIVIRYREFASDTYTFEQQGASLNVTYRCDQKWYQSLVQGMFGGIARASQSITVEVPPQYAGLLNARTTNASLTADSLPKLTECRLATTNGTLRVSDITADTFILSTTNAGVHLDRLQGAALFVTSTNGSIHLADLAMTGELTARTTNASLQADRVEAAAGQFNTTNGSLALRNGSFSGTVSAGTTNASLKTDAVEAPEADFTTQSGSVRLENSRFAARVSVRTTNAGIRVDQLASPDIRLSSTNGSIKGTIAGSQQDYSIVTNTTNGSASPSSVINKQAPGQLNATTSNSSITLTFTGAYSAALLKRLRSSNGRRRFVFILNGHGRSAAGTRLAKPKRRP